MEWLQYDLLRVQYSNMQWTLKCNKTLTFVLFCSLMLTLVLINLYQPSVWHYFLVGIFTCSMFQRIVEKTALKEALKKLESKINSIKGNK